MKCSEFIFEKWSGCDICLMQCILNRHLIRYWLISFGGNPNQKVIQSNKCRFSTQAVFTNDIHYTVWQRHCWHYDTIIQRYTEGLPTTKAMSNPSNLKTSVLQIKCRKFTCWIKYRKPVNILQNYIHIC